MRVSKERVEAMAWEYEQEGKEGNNHSAWTGAALRDYLELLETLDRLLTEPEKERGDST